MSFEKPWTDTGDQVSVVSTYSPKVVELVEYFESLNRTWEAILERSPSGGEYSGNSKPCSDELLKKRGFLHRIGLFETVRERWPSQHVVTEENCGQDDVVDTEVRSRSVVVSIFDGLFKSSKASLYPAPINQRSESPNKPNREPESSHAYPTIPAGTVAVSFQPASTESERLESSVFSPKTHRPSPHDVPSIKYVEEHQELSQGGFNSTLRRFFKGPTSSPRIRLPSFKSSFSTGAKRTAAPHVHFAMFPESPDSVPTADTYPKILLPELDEIESDSLDTQLASSSEI